ncbi:O-antigen/teichoic acid export membrane protein [Parabacteroides sp. PFB2-10]|uniref:lipopolysaccharide biosynthesis protein n=1 Tax=Parabacteroides sp. PFB2-10 TaxID=1742405 RepID=UPI002473103D|nr:lipopolysaccharide biosynthesis protein [Parabacteroides sp. PFB2-10]MDH6314015.1 O-antigen/teichoic acid export membrane protein [Parabacteroides sp. PFB2-10]MDL2244640.1 lipopolysaccharide biosynthesis protein [Parabacteroides sp. OttesenSCG-928-J18]
MEVSLKTKTAKGLFWGGMSSGIQQVIAAVIGVLFLKYLSADDYGIVGLLSIFIAIANTLQEGGFSAALINRGKEEKKDYNAFFWFSTLLSLFFYLILYFCAPPIAAFYNQPDLTMIARVLFLSLPLQAITFASSAMMARRLMIKERAIIDIISILISGTVGVVMAIQGYAYWALVAQTVANALMKAFLIWFFSPFRPSFSFDFSPIKEMFPFSVKLILSSITNQIQGNIYSVLLGKFYSKTEVGIYSQGVKWANMGSSVLIGMVSSVGQPLFATIQNDRMRQLQVLRKMMRFVAFTVFPVLLGIAFIGREFISVINEEWLPCVPILQICCVSSIFGLFGHLYNQLIMSHGKSSFFFGTSIVFAFLQIGSAFLTLPFGLYWMAFASMVISFISLGVTHFYTSTLIPIRLTHILKDITPYLFITVVIFVAVYFITRGLESMLWRLILKISLSVFLYVFVMWRSNSTIFRESVNMILKRKTNL